MTDQLRCPFCGFDRSHPPRNDPSYSAVESMRSLAVHLTFAHPGLTDELFQTVSDDWLLPNRRVKDDPHVPQWEERRGR